MQSQFTTPAPAHYPNSFPDRFWAHVGIGSQDQCWLWRGYIGRDGYGSVGTGKRHSKDQAHRVAWKLTYGGIQAGLCVLHRCDVRACVNPHHLFLGSRADNTVDMLAKGRSIWQTDGSAFAQKQHRPHPYNAKLTPEQVCEIRQRHATEGISGCQLARLYRVSQTAISALLRGKTFGYVD